MSLDPAWIAAQRELHERHAAEHGPTCMCHTDFELPLYDEDEDDYTWRHFLKEVAAGLGTGLLIVALLFLLIIL